MLASGRIKCVSPCAGQKGKVFSVGQRIQELGEERIMVTLREEVEEVRWGRRGRNEGGSVYSSGTCRPGGQEVDLVYERQSSSVHLREQRAVGLLLWLG